MPDELVDVAEGRGLLAFVTGNVGPSRPLTKELVLEAAERVRAAHLAGAGEVRRWPIGPVTIRMPFVDPELRERGLVIHRGVPMLGKAPGMEPREEDAATEEPAPAVDPLTAERQKQGPLATAQTDLDPAVGGYRDAPPKGHVPFPAPDPKETGIARDTTTSAKALGGDPEALGLEAMEQHPDGIRPGHPYGTPNPS